MATETELTQQATAVKALIATTPTSVAGTIITAIIALAEEYGPQVLATVLPQLITILVTHFPGSASLLAALQKLFASITIPPAPPTPAV